MADVDINKFRASVVRDGSKPASPGFVVSEGQDPVDPSGSGQNHLPVTIAAAATGLSITESQVLGGAGTTLQYLRGDASLATFPDLTGYVPYTGANQTVNLNTQQLQAGHTTLTTNGSTETLTINHTSGSGKAINVTKGGAGEGLYVNKTSGSGNAATIVGTLEATTLVKTGGTSSQFLKADGSVDSTAYGTGTVTSVAALTLGTTGTDLTSTVANGTTTPVITLNVPTASATNRGALSSADWTTFNGKENAITAGTTAQYFRGDKTFQTLNTAAVPELTNLYYTEARVNANANVAANTAARHAAVTLGTANGLSLSTQQLSLGLASSGVTGALSGTDWTTFNSKQNALTNPVTGTGTTNYLPKFTGSTTIGNSNIQDSGTLVTVGVAATFSSTVAATQGNFTSAPSLGGHQIQAVSNSGGNTSYGGVLLLSSTAKGAYLTCGDNSVTTWYGAQASFVTLGGTAGVGMKFRVDAYDTKGITIPTSGNVGIGTASPSQALSIGDGTSTKYIRVQGSVSDSYFGSDSLGTFIGNNSNAPIYFNTNGTEQMRIFSDGNVLIQSGGTFSNNGARLQVSGAATFSSTVATTGIKFPASQVASADANTLDDYEEGTWSPNVDPQTGTYVMVFGSRGTYTKIGRVVTVQYYFRVVNKGTGSGSCILSNLPFASLTTSTDDSYTGTGIRQGNYLNTLVINQNSSSINITENTGDPIVQGQWNAGSITYFT
jgi:hypothetical protein